MSKCDELSKWLRANLGARALAPLTGTDQRALDAAVHVLELYTFEPVPAVVESFGTCVRCMQPSTRHLAYHAIAFVMDWTDRDRMWNAADLPVVNPGRCKHDPNAPQRSSHVAG